MRASAPRTECVPLYNSGNQFDALYVAAAGAERYWLPRLPAASCSYASYISRFERQVSLRLMVERSNHQLQR